MSQQHVGRSLQCHKLQGIWGLRRVHQDQSLCELRCSSERAGPGFILFQGNVTIFAQHIGEQSPSVTHCGFVVETFLARYCQKVCLCFSFGHEVVFLSTWPIYMRWGVCAGMVATLVRWPPRWSVVDVGVKVAVELKFFFFHQFF